VDWVDWEYCKSAKSKVESLKKNGVQIVSLEQTDKSINYKKAKYDFPVALVVGHELRGVSKNVLEISDLSVEIPMFGRANSLNVATSCAVVLYEMVGQKN
jgi:tRNA G18 (ribose-2'-O)-methylase SpoU